MLLIAWSGYGQIATNERDSTVTISVKVANQIEKDLKDGELAKLQVPELLAANALLKADKADLLTYSKDLEKQFRKKKRSNTVFKISLPIAFIGGIILGSQ